MGVNEICFHLCDFLECKQIKSTCKQYQSIGHVTMHVRIDSQKEEEKRKQH